MSGRFFAIVNGAAGGGRGKERFASARKRLEAGGITLEVRYTERPGHATEIARAADAAGERRFLCVGGDGTTFEVLNGLFPRDRADVTLTSLPLGTGNSFLRDFGIVGEEAALSAILRGREREVDVVRMTHAAGTLHYVNLLGLGFTAAVGKLTNDRFKGFGVLGYVAAVIAEVASLEHPVDPIRVDGGATDARPAAMLVFSNSKYTGGAMMMAPKADVSDGQLDVIRIGPLSRASLLRQFPKIFSGTHVDGPDVEESHARSVEFVDGREQPCMIDGEILVLAPRRLEVLPRALRVVA